MTNKEIATRIKELDDLPNTVASAQERGNEFEDLMIEYFSNEGVLISNPYYTKIALHP